MTILETELLALKTLGMAFDPINWQTRVLSFFCEVFQESESNQLDKH